LTKKIVEMHDGRIKYSTVENKGSTFIISLPIIEKLEVTSLLDHFEPAFRLDESVMDFSEYFTDVAEEEEITEV
ncbi:MAG: ATP-binding protein, partial [Ignavibacteria bacterium]